MNYKSIFSFIFLALLSASASFAQSDLQVKKISKMIHGVAQMPTDQLTPLYRSDGSVVSVPTEETAVLKAIAPAPNNLVPTLVVTKTADTNDGVCSIADCSLREALDVADGNGVPDVIGFNISLSNPGCFADTCEIDLADGFVPAADGGNLTTIDATGSPTRIILDAQNASRHFTILANRKIAMNGFTLRRGNGTGGGISNFNGGGAILVIQAGSELTLNNMTLRNNIVDGDGGAINVNSGGTLVMTNSTVNNNTSNGAGGGILAIGDNGGYATLTNVTVAGNATNFNGGGGVAAYFYGASINATSLTVADNAAYGTINGGGGILRQDGVFSIRNSIVARNTHAASPDAAGVFSSGGYNFIGKNDGSNFAAGNPNANNEIVGTIAAPQEPLLGGLTNNGGLTFTINLAFNSPAIDKGNSFGTTLDQRRVTRPVDSPSITNAAGGDGADIGAFELRTEVDLSVSLVVSPDPSAPGGVSTYQITLKNDSDVAHAQNIVLTQSDFFRQRNRTRLAVESISAPPEFTCSTTNPLLDSSVAAEVVCQGANLGAGETAQFTIVKRQRTPLAPGTIIYHEAEAGTNSFEANAQNNFATDTTFVQ